MSIENPVVTILAAYLPEAMIVIEKLAKKAKKYGCPDIAITVSEVRIEKRYVSVYDNDLGEYVASEYVTEVVDLIVTGDAPKVGDYTFVARITNEDGLVLVDAVPNQIINPRFREGDTHSCEHCKKQRVRKDVYIVEDTAGVQVQVGRTCLRDFLAIDDPKKILNRFNLLREFHESFSDDDFYVGGDLGPQMIPVQAILEYTNTVIRLFGWVSRAQAYNDEQLRSTASYVSMPFGFCDNEERHILMNIIESKTEEDTQKALATIEYFNTLEVVGDNDYLKNLKALLSVECVRDTRLSMVASAIPAYDRAVAIETKKTREYAAKAQSEHVASEGDRVKAVKAKVDFIKVIGPGFAYNSLDRFLIKFVTEDMNILSWFTEGSKGLNVGEDVILDFTVKAHNVYNDVKETLITRAKIL